MTNNTDVAAAAASNLVLFTNFLLLFHLNLESERARERNTFYLQLFKIKPVIAKKDKNKILFSCRFLTIYDFI